MRPFSIRETQPWVWPTRAPRLFCVNPMSDRMSRIALPTIFRLDGSIGIGDL